MKIKELKARWMVDIKDSEIQRNLIWNETFKTKLIESILDNKPIGVITLFNQDDSEYWEIIDGKQRIYALESFWKGELSYQGKYFSPKDFTEQEIDQFWNYEILIQEANGNFQDKVNLFNKINTCVEPLKTFELLRAKYYGNFIDGLQNYVSQDKNIKQILKVNNRGENELIILGILNNFPNIDNFLYQNKNEDFNKFIKEPRAIFLFINDVFKNYGNLKILIELAKTYQKHKTELLNNRDSLNNDIKNLLNSYHIEGWNKLSSYERILDRYTFEKDNKRLFTPEIKKYLWDSEFKANNKVLCKLCLQEIDSIDKAEVDHIQPWSKGGKTEIKNAQLCHKICNIRKGNK